MLANVTLVAYTIVAVTLFTAGSTMTVSICPFEGLFVEEFLGSFFVTLVLFALSIALLGVISPFAIRVLMRGGRDRRITDLTLLGYVRMAFEQTGKQTGIQGHANRSLQEHDDKDEEEKMRAEWILVLLAFAVNAALRGAVGGPVLAAALSFAVGTLALLVAVLVAREGAPSAPDLAGAPWWRGPGDFLGRST